VIDVVHRRVKEKSEELSLDSLRHGSLGMDSYVKYIHTMGQYRGLQMALEIIEEMMGRKGDTDE
jgi:hypothetical protein